MCGHTKYAQCSEDTLSPLLWAADRGYAERRACISIQRHDILWSPPVLIEWQTGRLGISVHNLSITCKWVSEKTSSRQFVNRGPRPAKAP